MERARHSAADRADVLPVRYDRILVPLDGTLRAETAIHPAAALAAKADASLHLISVLRTEIEGAKAVRMEPMTPAGVGPSPRRTRERQAILEDVAERVRAEWGLTPEWEMLADRSPSEALVRRARELNVDLVVAATRSRGWLARGLLGSTSWDLVEAGDFPVLLIPSGEEASGDEVTEQGEVPMQGPVKAVVVALAPEAGVGDAAVAHAFAWATLWDAKLRVVQVVVTIPVPSAGPEGTGPVALAPNLSPEPMSFAEAESQVGSVVAALSARGADAEAELLEGTDAADTLLDFVESSRADLLVVGRHHRRLWERVFVGSDSGKIARRIRSAGLLICHERGG